MGDLNAHTPMFSPYGNNSSGRAHLSFIEINNLIIMNDGQSTFGDQLGGTGSVLDMVVVSPSLGVISDCWTSSDAYGSDHFPVFLTVKVRLAKSCDSSNRLRLAGVDWASLTEMTKQSIIEVNQMEQLSAT